LFENLRIELAQIGLAMRQECLSTFANDFPPFGSSTIWMIAIYNLQIEESI